MSTAVAAQSSGQHPNLSRNAERHQTRSSPRTVAYGPIGGTRTRTASNGYRMSPGSPRSPNEDERAAMQIQQLSAGRYEKPSPPNPQTSRAKASSSDISPSHLPKIKTERAASPETHTSSRSQSSRHRPRRLDLSSDMPNARSAAVPADRPLNSREGGALSALQDMSIACLSPGFQTSDPEKQQQLARSMDVREQQRLLIESRLHDKAVGKDTSNANNTNTTNGNTNGNTITNSANGNNSGNTGSNEKPRSSGDSPSNNNFSKPPSSSTTRRKGPPPGLSIAAPSAQQFANEPRVIQSAPINHTFTGLKPAPAHVHPLSRQVLEHTHHHNQYHQAATGPQFAPLGGPQSSNTRLPPISDVFANGEMGTSNYADRDRERDGRTLYASIPAPVPSPGYPPPPSAGLQPPSNQASTSRSRERDFRSADEAVQSLSGGRDELVPRAVHYGGHQPPTPPSPLQSNQNHSAPPAALQNQAQGSVPAQPQYAPINTSNYASTNGLRPEVPRTVSGSRRRTRDEYEADLRTDPGSGGDRMDIDRDERERESQRMRLRERERDRGSAAMAYWEEGVRGAMRDREREEMYGRLGDGRERDAMWEERTRRKREEFLALCARAWDLLHE